MNNNNNSNNNTSINDNDKIKIINNNNNKLNNNEYVNNNKNDYDNNNTTSTKLQFVETLNNTVAAIKTKSLQKPRSVQDIVNANSTIINGKFVIHITFFKILINIIFNNFLNAYSVFSHALYHYFLLDFVIIFFSFKDLTYKPKLCIVKIPNSPKY